MTKLSLASSLALSIQDSQKAFNVSTLTELHNLTMNCDFPLERFSYRFTLRRIFCKRKVVKKSLAEKQRMWEEKVRLNCH